jgi:hypothetical protein
MGDKEIEKIINSIRLQKHMQKKRLYEQAKRAKKAKFREELDKKS